jgi:hypothetical protein
MAWLLERVGPNAETGSPDLESLEATLRHLTDRLLREETTSVPSPQDHAVAS